MNIVERLLKINSIINSNEKKEKIIYKYGQWAFTEPEMDAFLNAIENKPDFKSFDGLKEFFDDKTFESIKSKFHKTDIQLNLSEIESLNIYNTIFECFTLYENEHN